MNEEHTEARDAGVLVFGRFAAMLAEAATPFVIVRLLGKADVGAFAGLMLVYTTISVVLTAGFPAAVLYYLADRGRDQRRAITLRLLGTVTALGVLIAGLVAAIGLFGEAALLSFGQWYAEAFGGEQAAVSAGDTTDLSHLTLFSLFALFDVPSRVFPNLLIAEQRARGAALFGVVRAIGMTTGTLLPAALGFGVEGIVWGLTAYAVLQAGGIAAAVSNIYQGAQRQRAEVKVSEFVAFAFPLGLTDVVSQLNAAVDRYLILLLMTAAAFAEYRTGAWQIPVTTIAYSVGHVYMPRFVRLFKAGKAVEAVAIWRESIQKVSLVVVPICMVFVVAAEEFVRVAFTDDYIAAAPIFRLYALLTMGRVASFGAVILAAGAPKLILRAAGVALGSNLLISIPLVLSIGFVGPALGTALAFIPTVAVYCRYISRVVGVPFNRTFPLMAYLGVLATAAVPAALALVLVLWLELHPGVELLLVAGIVIGGFVPLARATGVMTAEDQAFAASWLKLDFLRRRA